MPRTATLAHFAALGLLVASASAQPAHYDATHTLPPILVAQNTMDAAAGDLDGDGDLDIVLASEFAPNIVLLNDGSGHFANESARLPRPPGTWPENWPGRDSEDIALADLDSDGDLDIVIATEDDIKQGGTGVHEVYLNDGDARFTAVANALPDTEANAVEAADLNGDGHIDIILGNAGQDLLLVGDGTGRFSDETALRLPTESRTNQDLLLLDIDADGDLDLLVGNEDGNRLLVNDGTGTFTDETTERLRLPQNIETRKIRAADVDRDGDPDLYVANVGWRGTPPQDMLMLNDGTGRFDFAPQERYTASNLTSLDGQLGDLDGDGDPDLVVVGLTPENGQLGAARVETYRNKLNGYFDPDDSLLPGMPFEARGLVVLTADFDGDGANDVFLGDRGGQDRLFLSGEPPHVDPADVASADAIIEALYASISGPAGEPRDWDRFLSLFHPDARLIPTAPRPTGDTLIVVTPQQYIEMSGSLIVATGFAESEVARRTESFGPVHHVFSAYEGGYAEPPPGVDPSVSGINSIQLMDDGTRWWILSIFWSSSSAERPLPEWAR